MENDVFIGPSTNVLTPIFELGDYVKLNNHVLVNGYAGCYVGHNSWIGQNSLLNAVEDLVIGNNVSLGIADLRVHPRLLGRAARGLPDPHRRAHDHRGQCLDGWPRTT